MTLKNESISNNSIICLVALSEDAEMLQNDIKSH